MDIINCLGYLDGSNTKKSSRTGTFSLKFDAQKKKNAARTDKQDGEETWALSRFFPLIEELIEKLSKGELPLKEYPSMSEPSSASASQDATQTASSTARPAQNPQPMSMRSRRTPTWAKSRNSDDSSSDSSVLRHASGDFKRLGNRIFVFMIGGATRSELRTVHKLTMKMKREIVLGSSSIDDPPQFISKLKSIGSATKT